MVMNDKNPHAVALGRRGGVKGGMARANNLSPARRREIARKAANARWGSSVLKDEDVEFIRHFTDDSGGNIAMAKFYKMHPRSIARIKNAHKSILWGKRCLDDSDFLEL